MARSLKRRFTYRPRDAVVDVYWSMTFGVPEVTLDFTHEDGRPIQVRFTLDEAHRVSLDMWRTANRAVAKHRRAG